MKCEHSLFFMISCTIGSCWYVAFLVCLANYEHLRVMAMGSHY